MIDMRRLLAFLRLELLLPESLLDRFEVAGMFVEGISRRFADFSTRHSAQQLRGFSARVVYNDDADYKREAA
jgi:hypothetical protein